RLAGVQDVNARALDGLVRSGACDGIGERNQLLASLDFARQRAEQARRDRESGQISIFGLVEEPESPRHDYGGQQVAPMPADEKFRLRFEPDRVVVVQGKVDAARPAGSRGAPQAPAALDDELEVEEEAEAAVVLAELAWAWDDPECGPVDRQQLAHVDVPD